MSKQAPVLVVGDSRLQSAIEAGLGADTVVFEETTTAGVEYLRDSGADIACVVIEHEPPDRDCFTLLETVETDRPVVVVAREGSSALASNALRAGAADYVDPTAEDGGFDAVVAVIERHRDGGDPLDQYRDLVELVGDPMYVLDDDGTVDIVNQAMCELLGIDRAELVGSHVTDIVSTEAVRAGTSTLRELLDAEGTQWDTYEMEITDSSGEQVVIENKLRPLTDETGELCGSIGMYRDITAHKRRERQLARKNERLEQFTSVVSHDLRTPVQKARSGIDLLGQECESEYLAEIERAVDRMDQLLDDLLQLAKHGDQITELQPVDLGEMVEESWPSRAPATLSVESSLPTIQAEPSRLKQLLENLFRNAVEHGSTSSRTESDDATEHGGESVTVWVGVEEGEDTIYVADDGPGIEPDRREQVFEHGYTDSEDGTGFGLSIVQRVVDVFDWEITVTDSRGGGARFEIRDIEVV